MEAINLIHCWFPGKSVWKSNACQDDVLQIECFLAWRKHPKNKNSGFFSHGRKQRDVGIRQNRQITAATLQPIKTESELEWNRCPVKMHRHFSLGAAGFLRVSDYTGPLVSSAQLWKWSKLIEGNAECWDGYFNFNHCLIAATNDKFRWWMDTNGKWCWRKAMSKDKWLC